MSDKVTIGTTGGVTVKDATERVLADGSVRPVIAADQQRTVIATSQKAVVVKSAALTSNSDFQNLFIGFAGTFPAVNHPSLLLRSGDYPDDTVYQPYILDED